MSIFLIVLARVGGLVSFAPFWSHRAATKQVRVWLAFAIALVVTPTLINRIPPSSSNPLGLMIVIFGELLIGFAIGFVGRVVFSALEIAAKVFGDVIGFSLAATIDPSTQAQTAALGTIAQMIGMMVLLAMNGHHWLLTATIRSYSLTQAGAATVTPELIEVLLRLSSDVLAMGLGLAAPAIVVLLGVEIVLAIAGRAAPQLQVMIVGFPLKIAAGLWLLGATLYFVPAVIRGIFSTLRTALTHTLSAM